MKTTIKIGKSGTTVIRRAADGLRAAVGGQSSEPESVRVIECGSRLQADEALNDLRCNDGAGYIRPNFAGGFRGFDVIVTKEIYTR